ncbi:hypothetical protein [Klebsiella phage vB_KpnS-VAC51]|uniref:Uncharacterized protein n=1 Tax=Klebsiella phage vB_KpnS-VAC51 TaxID=2866698 RepID=A0AAE8YDP7_9CAUD|nr:hypothetical protein [Klebsiella phage vB_KpnS-VAC51]
MINGWPLANYLYRLKYHALNGNCELTRIYSVK